FIQRMLNAMHRLEDEVWEYQALKAREASNCKFLVLNPHMKEGTAFDFSGTLQLSLGEKDVQRTTLQRQARHPFRGEVKEVTCPTQPSRR
ncbi:MAG: hypothetical protein ACREXY_26070, partial [Gammaproteobacteria bacterium]